MIKYFLLAKSHSSCGKSFLTISGTGHAKQIMCAHWEVCSCFLFESINFSTLIKLSWITLLLMTQTEQGRVRLSTLFLAGTAFCLPILWYCLFPSLVFFPSTTQWIFLLLTWSSYILSIASLSHICFLLTHYVPWNFAIFCTNLPIPLLWFAISLHYFRSSVSFQHEMGCAGRKTQQLYWMCSGCLRWLLDNKEIANFW